MGRVYMKATRRTEIGVLREGKRYPVPDGLRDELVEEGAAIDLDGPQQEAAVRSPTESAAERTGGPQEWTLATPPEEYLDTYGNDARNSDLAKRILAEEAGDE